MNWSQFYFFNGTAYAGKSTLVKRLAEAYGGIACEENYHDAIEPNWDDFPCLRYTHDLKDWHDFVRRTPDEYEAWINGVSKECEILELQILQNLRTDGRPVFVDTNISIETLQAITDRDHVLIMLADPEISIKRFFERPDREKQFLYQLLLEEPDPAAAMENFRQCLARINSQQNYDRLLHSGFQVLLRDENRTIEETVQLAAKMLKLN